ncbi:MAG TPA: hypothetical protein V6D23_06445 [Candidatus Obscuribacterales bacterium]
MTKKEPWVYNDRARMRLIVCNPRPELGLDYKSIWLTPRLLRNLLTLSEDGELRDFSRNEFRQLCEIGVLTPASELAPKVFFQPRLGTHWPELTPSNARPGLQDWSGLELCPGLDLAAESPREWPENLLEPDAVPLWLPPRSCSELVLPFVPSSEMRQILQALVAGQTAVDELPAELVSLLATAGVLRRPQAEADFWLDQGQPLAQARNSLAERGYVVLRQVVNPLHLGALRDISRSLEQGGYFEVDQIQVLGRLLFHNHPLMQFIHLQLTQLLRDIVPAPVKPSYSYLAIYPGGCELKRHLDRRQCAWNVSLALDMKPNQAPSWPFCLEFKDQVHSLELELGDLLLYSGTETPHWRPLLPKEQRAATALFHFVNVHYSGDLD